RRHVLRIAADEGALALAVGAAVVGRASRDGPAGGLVEAVAADAGCLGAGDRRWRPALVVAGDELVGAAAAPRAAGHQTGGVGPAGGLIAAAAAATVRRHRADPAVHGAGITAEL